MRYLLSAVWILLSAGTASAGWDEVMDMLERASGPKYDLGADPAEPEWVATRKARFESERARMRSANLESESAEKASPLVKSFSVNRKFGSSPLGPKSSEQQ